MTSRAEFPDSGESGYGPPADAELKLVLGSAGASPSLPIVRLSNAPTPALCQNLFHDVPMHIGQTVIAALELVRQPFVINPELVE